MKLVAVEVLALLKLGLISDLKCMEEVRTGCLMIYDWSQVEPNPGWTSLEPGTLSNSENFLICFWTKQILGMGMCSKVAATKTARGMGSLGKLGELTDNPSEVGENIEPSHPDKSSCRRLGRAGRRYCWNSSTWTSTLEHNPEDNYFLVLGNSLQHVLG